MKVAKSNVGPDVLVFAPTGTSRHLPLHEGIDAHMMCRKGLAAEAAPTDVKDSPIGVLARNFDCLDKTVLWIPRGPTLGFCEIPEFSVPEQVARRQRLDTGLGIPVFRDAEGQKRFTGVVCPKCVGEFSSSTH